MSKLLLRWLNDQVGLSQPITGFETEFRNGYLIGEILYRFNQQDDFSLFENDDSTQTKINNFVRLEKTFQRLNVKGFDSVTAHSVVKGSEEATIDLLYKIQMQLEKINTVVGRGSGPGLFQNEKDDKQYLVEGTYVALSQMPLKLPRPAFDDTKSRMFEKSMRTRLEGYGAILMRRHLQKFQDEKQRQIEYINYLKELALEEQKKSYEEDRLRRLDNHKNELRFLKDWHDKGIGIWMENQKLRKYQAEVMHRHKMKTAQKKCLREKRAYESSKSTAEQGVKEFEVRLHNIGIDLDRETDNLMKQKNIELKEPEDEESALVQEEEEFYRLITNNSILPSEENAQNFPVSENNYKDTIEKLITERKGEIPSVDKQAMSTYLVELKRRKGLDKREKERRECRRKHFLSQQQQRYEDVNVTDQKEQALKVETKRDSRNELKLKKMMRENSTYKNIIIENQEYKKLQQRKMEEDEKQRDLERSRVKEAEYQNTLMEEIQWQHVRATALSESEDATRHHDALETCIETTRNLINLAFKVIDHRVTSDRVPLVEVERELKSQLFSDIMDDTGDVDLQEVEFEDYFNGTGNWKYDEIKNSKLVGDCLKPIRNIAKPPPPLPSPPDIPRFKLQISLFGAPLSGKSNLAVRLARKHGLYIINPDSLLEKAIESGDEAINIALRKGTMTDSILIDLVVKEIHKIGLENQICENESKNDSQVEDSYDSVLRLLFESWDSDKSGKINCKKLFDAVKQADRTGISDEGLFKEAVEVLAQFDFDFTGEVPYEHFKRYFDFMLENYSMEQQLRYVRFLKKVTSKKTRIWNGWILDGFPRTKQQAKQLEIALTGLDPESLGYIPYEAITACATPPKPIDPELLTKLEASGIDLAFLFDLEETTVFNRAAKQTVESKDNMVDACICRSNVGEATVRYRKSSNEIREWFEKFNTLRVPALYSVETGDPESIDGIFKILDESIFHTLKIKQEATEKLQRENENKRRLDVLTAFFDTWYTDSTDCENEETKDEGNNDFPKQLCLKHIDLLDFMLTGEASTENKVLEKDDVVQKLLEHLEQKLEANVNSSESFNEEFDQLRESLNSFRKSTQGKIWAMLRDWRYYYSSYLFENEEERRYLNWGIVQSTVSEVNQNLEKLSEEEEKEDAADIVVLPENLPAETEVFVKEGMDVLSNQILNTKMLEVLKEGILKDIENDASSNKKLQRKEETEEVMSESEESQDANIISEEIATEYVKTIDRTDEAYVKGTKAVFKELSSLRSEYVQHWANMRSKFYKFLQRVDKKEETLNAFKEKFNNFPTDVRYHPETKAELCQQGEDFATTCLEEIRVRNIEADELLQTIKDDGWVEFYKKALLQKIFMLFRYEIFRFKNFSKTVLSIEKGGEIESLDSIRISEESVAELSEMFSEDIDLEGALNFALSLVENEHELLSAEYEHRVRMICENGNRLLQEVSDRATHHYEKFESWIMERIEAESLAVEKYAQYAKQMAETSQIIGHMNS